jgi:23S rRNA (uracil1939-C5)-methyltransferase
VTCIKRLLEKVPPGSIESLFSPCYVKAMTEKFQVKIDSMAFKGYGVARANSKVLFIPYSMTGDEAWVEVTEEKKNYSMGRLIEILQPSPWRVEPRCPYFGVCGGCQWQHIEYSKHKELKKEIVMEILKRLGGVKEFPPITLVPSSDPYGYRIRIQLKAKEGALGYYQERSHGLVDIGHCPIAHPLVNQIIPLLQKLLLPFSHLQKVEINVSPEEERGVLFLHPMTINQELENVLNEFLRAHPIVKGLSFGRKREWTFLGQPFLHVTIPLNRSKGKRYLRLQTSPGSFFQVNLKQNERLLQWVLKFSESNKERRVLDLFAGVGNLTLPLAVLSKEVWGVEENRTAVKDARLNAERNGIVNCHFIHGKAEDVLKHWERGKPDLIVLDPPRTGCKSTLDQVIGLKPERIVYVSCEPTTFARDLRLFSERGYHLHRVTLIDMFPQTYHVEVVGLLQEG